MYTDDITQIERNIVNSKAYIERGNALTRLMANRDFKKIIQEGYLKDEAIRLVYLKADPSMQNAQSQSMILTQIDALGALNEYFQVIQHTAAMAIKAVDADEALLEELLTEEK